MENQNPPPDYDFILNQPGQKVPSTSRGYRKKLIITGSICGVIILVTAILVLVANRQAAKNPDLVATKAPITATNPVDLLLASIKERDFNKGAMLLPLTEDDPSTAATNLENSLTDINIASCKVSPLVGAKANSFSTMTCRHEGNDYGIQIDFHVAQTANTPFIVDYSSQVVK